MVILSSKVEDRCITIPRLVARVRWCGRGVWKEIWDIWMGMGGEGVEGNEMLISKAAGGFNLMNGRHTCLRSIGRTYIHRASSPQNLFFLPSNYLVSNSSLISTPINIPTNEAKVPAFLSHIKRTIIAYHEDNSGAARMVDILALASES